MSTSAFTSAFAEKSGEGDALLESLLRKSMLLDTIEGIGAHWSASLNNLNSAISTLPTPLATQANLSDLVTAVREDTTALLETLQHEVSQFASIYEGDALPTSSDLVSFHRDVQHAFETYYANIVNDFNASDFWI